MAELVKTDSRKSNPTVVCASLWIFGIVLSVCISVALVKIVYQPAKIGYVETARLMIGFSEANSVQKAIKVENDKLQGQLKVIQDSLQVMIELISKEYNGAKPARQKELQDMLSARNQQLNNFKIANEQKIAQFEHEKMKSVIDKINVYLAEYGRQHGYSMIFGTLNGGNILFGNQKSYDITDRVVTGLNERYK